MHLAHSRYSELIWILLFRSCAELTMEVCVSSILPELTATAEEKLGHAFEGMRDKIFIASKTMGRTPKDFKEQLDTSLRTAED